MTIQDPVTELEPYQRDGRWYWRKRHNTVHSPRLRAFDTCVSHLARRGSWPEGVNPRDALRAAAHECHLLTLGVPSSNP